MSRYLRTYCGAFSLLLIIISASGVFAQADDTRIEELSDDYSVRVPADWELDEGDGGFYFTSDDDQQLFIVPPDALIEEMNLKGNTPLDRLPWLAFNALFGEPFFEQGESESVRYNGLRAHIIDYYTDGRRNITYDGILGVVELDDGVYAYFDLLAPEGELDDNIDVLSEALTSLAEDVEPQQAQGGSDAGTCTVSVDEANTATLRVGPGENRSAVAFLPADGEYEVTGAFTADDGSEWFQLDKSEAAPNSAANEVWVARDDVDENGDCNNVGTTDAPPIIPGNSLSPPPPAGATAAPGGVTGTVPQAGRWTFSYAATGNGSCQGGRNTPFSTIELGESLTQVYTVGVQQGGQQITIGLDLLTRSGNGYFGTFDFGDGFNAQIYITDVSAITMRGQTIVNDTFNGVPCSITIGFSMSRN